MVHRTLASSSERNPHQHWDMKYTWPHKNCESSYVIMIKSKVENSKIREKLRENFMTKYKYESLQQFFVLGNGGGVSEEQIKRMKHINSAYSESEKYGDIIFGDFDDHNQVLKSLLSYKFVFEKCPAVKEGFTL